MRKSYELLNLDQGTDEWKQTRFDYVTASQVASLFNLNPYQKREQLLQEKLTRQEKPLTDFQKTLFATAHKAEPKCREWVEKDLGLTIKPVVMVSKKCPDLLASLDGFNEENKIIFEAKYFESQSTFEDVRTGKLKNSQIIQIQTQLYVSGATKCVYFGVFKTGEAVTCEVFPDKFYHLFIPKYVTEFMDEVRRAKSELKKEAV